MAKCEVSARLPVSLALATYRAFDIHLVIVS